MNLTCHGIVETTACRNPALICRPDKKELHLMGWLNPDLGYAAIQKRAYCVEVLLDV
jgi:hypothetical protein